MTVPQAARLAEIFDFLHRGMTQSLEQFHSNDEGTVVKLGFNEWQTLQAVQMCLAQYMRAVADPEGQSN